MAAASYHPRILSPKYGQTGNVKLLTANGSLSFAVKWPNVTLTCLLLPIARLHSRGNLTLAMNLLSDYENITASYQINISGSKSILSNVKNNKKLTLKNTVRQTSFQKPHLQFISIFKVVHRCLHFYLLFVIPSCMMSSCVSTQFGDSSQ